MDSSKQSLVDSIAGFVSEAKILQEREEEILSPFELELGWITDSGIRSFVKSILIKCIKVEPMASAFWEAPSGPIQEVPADETGAGGMVLHVRRLAKVLRAFAITLSLSPREFDILIAAALLHKVTKAIYINDRGDFSFDSMYMYTIDTVIDQVFNNDLDISKSALSNTLEIDIEARIMITRLIHCSLGALSPIPETFPVTELERLFAAADAVASNVHIIFPGSDTTYGC